MLKNLLSIAIIAGGTAISARAGMTAIGARPASELSHEQILERHYGLSFHRNGDDFYSGQVSAKRLDDWMGNIGVQCLGLGECGIAADQKFSGSFTVSAVAKFSGNSQNLSLADELGRQTSLMDVEGYGFDINHVSTTVNVKETFEFIRGGDSGRHSSVNGKNTDGRDHLMTYVIEGLESGPVFMLFWEDLTYDSGMMSRKRTFADYNDLVLEVRGAVHPVPLPHAAYVGLAMLSGMWWKRKSLARIAG